MHVLDLQMTTLGMKVPGAWYFGFFAELPPPKGKGAGVAIEFMHKSSNDHQFDQFFRDENRNIDLGLQGVICLALKDVKDSNAACVPSFIQPTCSS